MKPLDPRLWRYCRASRRYLLATAGAEVIMAIGIIVAALAVSMVLADLVTDPASRTFAAQRGAMAVFVAAMVVRMVCGYARDAYANKAATQVIGELRVRAADVLTDPMRTPPRQLVTVRARMTTLLTTGLDGLAPYLSGYIPQLFGSAIISPVVIVVIAIADPISGMIVAGTLPLIPLFMILIGKLTRDRTAERLDAMAHLQGQLLDLIAGLATLRAFGRHTEPAERVADLGAAYRRKTMGALRIAFLSSAVLELLATLSVALVAVSIGLRLVFGEMSLFAGVFALVLAPEVYRPLRSVGARFHDAEAGVRAADEVLTVIEDGDRVTQSRGSRTVVATGADITLHSLGVFGRDGWAPQALSATIPAGKVTVIAGGNGSGKSTVVQLILGLVTPDEGSVLIGDVPVSDCDLPALWEQVAWLPQLIVDESPRSAGQRQLSAVNQVLDSPAPLLLFDEPTAHLPAQAEPDVLARMVARARAGDTVVIVAHRDSLKSIADHVIDLDVVVDHA